MNPEDKQQVTDARRTLEQRNAESLTSSALPAALVVAAYSRSSTGPVSILHALREKAAELDEGSLLQVEQMLLHQAITLQTIFTNMALRANEQQDLSAANSLMQLALKAQSGSRATLQTLNDLKNPRPVFVRQTNVAQTQQVNNGGHEFMSTSRAKNQPIAPNELKALNQDQHGSTILDTRATAAAGATNSAEQALGALHRTAKRRR